MLNYQKVHNKNRWKVLEHFGLQDFPVPCATESWQRPAVYPLEIPPRIPKSIDVFLYLVVIQQLFAAI